MTTIMGEDSKNTIHPFFNKGPKPSLESTSKAKPTLLSSKPTIPSLSGTPANIESSTTKPQTSGANTKVKRSVTPSHSVDSNAISTSNSLNAAHSLEVDPNARRRKRQKRKQPIQEEDNEQDALPTSSRVADREEGNGNSLLWMSELRLAAAAADDIHEPMSDVHQKPKSQEELPLKDKEETLVSAEVSQLSSQDESLSISLAQQMDMTTVNDNIQPSTSVLVPAVKLLRFNPKTGTIGPPPKKLAKNEDIPKQKASGFKRARKPKSMVIVMKYNQDAISKSTIGETIGQILQTVTPVEPQPSKAQETALPKLIQSSEIPNPQTVEARKLPKLSKPDQAPKATHPFFLGKAISDTPVRRSTSKEKDLAAETPLTNASPLAVESDKATVIGRVSPTRKPKPKSSLSAFGKVQSVAKKMGEIETAWPWQGMVHIRGTGKDFLADAPALHMRSEKKWKKAAIQVFAHEDVLTRFGAKFGIKQGANGLLAANLDPDQDPVKAIRMPSKHFKSGHQLRQQIRSEIVTQLPIIRNVDEDSSSDDEIQGNGRTRLKTHPAISRVYKSIPSLSAFDRYECETQSWIQKYAPLTAEEVLQSGKEAIILRDWLQTLTVTLVEGGHKDGKATSLARTGKGPIKRRKKTGKAMDDFVVSSDEDDYDMDELSEPDQEVYFTGSRGAAQKTVVRSRDITGNGSGKLANAVVISGPCGSGKTAAIHAVAKELDFEIFEINPGSRRSGKDILEKVGDMTRNHLVQRATENGSASSPPDDEMQRISDALDQDLKSGRQGTMNSFFKPSATAKPKLKYKNKTAGTEPVKPVPKKQKQSLILIEEVDILYEEDKQFWATVIALISQSKRPVVMTCNDESVVPLQSLSLHAIIRITPAPVDLAVDYMLLVAASEGHVLKRKAVKALYESRGVDLRGSLTELQFWCQLAVGDSTNGLNWRYDRWPPGSDKDSHGNTVRTVSEGTYDIGMGWLGRDLSNEDRAVLDVEEEGLRQAWHAWQLDAGDWHETLDTTKWADRLQWNLKSKADKRLALKIYDCFADAMSASDVCTGRHFASEKKTLLDYTTPELPEKARDEYVLGYPLLQADDLESYDFLGAEISFWLKSRARENAQVDQIQLGWKPDAEMDCLSEARTIEKIMQLRTRVDDTLTRQHLSIAFDPIAEPDRTLHTTSSLEPSVFDRAMALITLDVAPYIRSIVSYDIRLQEERLRLSNLVSAGGRAGKRKLRTTKAANAALEGGIRKTTRSDKYFGNILNSDLVLRTGKHSWQDAITSLHEDFSNMGGENFMTDD